MVNVGKRLRIVRPGEKATGGDRVELVIARGAFGSGEHETTVSCLEELEELELSGKRVLDVGCGTGILAIAALKLGAEEAVCVDIAREAIQTTLKNARLNGVGERLRAVLGTLRMLPEELRGGYQVVLANIYPEVLREIAPQVAGMMEEGGVLIGSGVLWEDNADVLRVYREAGFEVVKNRWLEQYTTFVLKLRG